MTSLTLVRRIAASPEIVFEAIGTREGIAAWWGPDAGPVLIAEMDARVGGRYRARFQMPDDDTARGHIEGWNGSLDKLERHLDPDRTRSTPNER